MLVAVLEKMARVAAGAAITTAREKLNRPLELTHPGLILANSLTGPEQRPARDALPN